MNQKHSGVRRARPWLVALLAPVGLVALAVPASAQIPEPGANETSGAFGAAAEGLVNLVTPAVSCDEGESDSQSALSASVPNVVSANVLQAECNGNSSFASVANATIGSGPGALRLGLIESRCEDGVGSSSVVNLGSTDSPNDDQLITEPTTLTVNGLITVRLNETTTNAQGETVQNAVHIIVGDQADPTEEVILAQARCQPGVPPPVIPEVPVAVIVPLSALGLFGAAYLVLRRRSGQATA